MIKANILQYMMLYIEIVGSWLYFVNECEVLIVGSLIKELELTLLKAEYSKGHKALEGREPLKIGDIENVWEPLELENPCKLVVRVFRGVCW